VDLLLGNMAGGLGIYYDQVISVENLSPSMDVTVYPNPASDRIEVQVHESAFGKTWHLVDATGREVLSGIVNRAVLQIDVQSLPNGVYLWSTQRGKTAKISVMHR
jgi:hypothetical protein